MSSAFIFIIGNTLVHGLPPGEVAAALEGGRRPTGRAAATRPRKLLCFSTRTFVYLKKLLKEYAPSPIAPKKRISKRKRSKPNLKPKSFSPPVLEHFGIRYLDSPIRWSEVFDPERKWGDLLPHQQRKLDQLLKGNLNF
jgi:hypothetical protein